MNPELISQEEQEKKARLQEKIQDAIEERNPLIGEDLYYKEHKACPQCGSTQYQTTLIAYISPVEKDENRVRCSCGWTGIMHDLVPEKSYEEKQADAAAKRKEFLERHSLTLTPYEEIEGGEFLPLEESDLNMDLIDLTKRILRFLSDIGGSVATIPQLSDKKIQGFVCWDRHNQPWVGYNPEYFTGEKKNRPKKQVRMAERCITYPKETFIVPRHKHIRAVWYEAALTDEDELTLVKKSKNLSGLDAQYFQYVADYCNGITLNNKKGANRLLRPDELELVEEHIKQREQEQLKQLEEEATTEE
jgi:peptide deformylase